MPDSGTLANLPQDEPDAARPDRVLGRLWTVLGEIVTLKVHTIQGAPDGPQSHRVGARLNDLQVRSDMVVSTSINLVDGDIQTVVPVDFFEPSQAALRDYHMQQVALARQIADTNLKSVAEVVERLTGTRRSGG